MADLDPADEGWEARMAERARQRRLNGDRLVGLRPTDDFSVYRHPGDPERILPQILAARCLGIEYGTLGDSEERVRWSMTLVGTLMFAVEDGEYRRPHRSGWLATP